MTKLHEKKFIAFFVAAVLAIALIFSLAGCGEKEDGPGDEGTKYTVTFVLYDGADNVTQSVAEGQKATEPEVSREGYELMEWYTDEALTAVYDFDTPVTADITLYADWKDLSLNYFTVTFHYNNGTEDFSREYSEKTRIAEPDEPVRDGFAFYGWYSDAELTKEYVFGYLPTADIDLYARWARDYVFEAEDTYVADMSSRVYSGSSKGRSLIVADSNNRGASNGYYFMGQYCTTGDHGGESYNTTLTFKINATEATSDARLVLRLSAAYGSFSINGTEYQVKVNGVTYNYDDITFTLPEGVDMYSAYLDFEDYVISSNVALVEGENTIELVVNNTQSLGGTTLSKAPVVDCIKLATGDGELSWADGPYPGNYS